MTDHLPECRHFKHDHAPDPWCDCGILHACEQRRDRENAPAVAAMVNDEYADGYAAGLRAAIDAMDVVDAQYEVNPDWVLWESRKAIEALVVER